MFVLWLLTASAGFPIALPEGEDADVWTEALSFADLELASRASLSLEITPSGWVIRAVSEEGRVRVLPVERPTTAEDREAVAVLARGLARELRLDVRPDELGALPPRPASPPPPLLPPPPPLPPAPVPPAPVSVPTRQPVPEEPSLPPEPVVEEPIVEEPAVEEPVIEEPEPGPDASERTELEEAVLPTFDGPRRRWWHTRIRHAPIALGGVGAVRSGFWPAAGAMVELRALDQAFSLDLGFVLYGARGFQLPYSNVVRDEVTVSMVVRPGVRVLPHVHAQLGVGVERRRYVQGFADIANVMLPALHPSVEVSPFPRSWIRPFVRVGASVDLVQTVLRDESNRPNDMSPVQGVGMLGLRISSRRDPNGEVTTW